MNVSQPITRCIGPRDSVNLTARGSTCRNIRRWTGLTSRTGCDPGARRRPKVRFRDTGCADSFRRQLVGFFGLLRGAVPD